MTRRIPRRMALLAASLLLAAGLQPSFAQLADRSTGTAPRTPTVFDEPDLVGQYQQTITPEDLAAHLYLFASDFFEGRETTTPGQKLAAHYLAAQYRKLGLQPKGTVRTDDPFAPEAYFQPFPVYGQRLKEARLEVTVNGRAVATSTFSPERQGNQAFLARGASPQAEGGVVFVGYGIADDDLGYNDYAAAIQQGIDLSGKWLLMLPDEPLAGPARSLLPTENGALSRWTTDPVAKLRAAYGVAVPRGLLVVGDVGPRSGGSIAQQAAQTAANLNRFAGRLSLEEPRLMPHLDPPMYVISAELANQILAPTGRTIEEVQRQINRTLEPTVIEVDGAVVKSTIERPVVQLQTENVLAYIEGVDPVLKDEVVVISSHYDHIGINPWQEGDNINNGADDDGSGTVTTLEIAEAFMRAKADGYGPRRSILFMNVSGEEKGLLGSAYYADREPVLPLDKTVTNLNIDMIGRFDPTHPTQSKNYVYIIGSNLISQELHDINERVNTLTGTGLELSERFNSKDDPNRFYARSDHWNFGKHNIPFIFFFTGTHEDYHGVEDEPDKIAYERMARIARLIFATAWQVANQDARPAVTGTGFH